jgi:hypothetical protein
MAKNSLDEYNYETIIRVSFPKRNIAKCPACCDAIHKEMLLGSGETLVYVCLLQYCCCCVLRIGINFCLIN